MMNHEETQESQTRIALDHFISHVFPTLFVGNKMKDPRYKRVFALVSARRKERTGQPSPVPVTDAWIEKILTEFGGTVGGQPRYSFNHVVTVTIMVSQ